MAITVASTPLSMTALGAIDSKPPTPPLPDPQFCPNGLLESSGGCSSIQSTIQAAIGDAASAFANPAVLFGTVYVDSGTYAEDVSIFNFTKPLTVTMGAGPTTPIINGSVTISNSSQIVFSQFAVTLGITATNVSNLTISDVSVSSTPGNGLLVTGNGNVTLANVQANQNGNNGASLIGNTGMLVISSSQFMTNTLGGMSVLKHVGDVLVDSSTFSDNGTSCSCNDGLEVASDGNITLTNVTANGNGFDGADLTNTGGSGGVSINGTSNSFSGNDGDGLIIASNGNVNLSHVSANKNDVFGAELGCLCTPIGGDVTISDSTFNSNGLSSADDGLDVSASGSISLTNVIANGNGSLGAYVDNSSSTVNSAVSVSSSNFDDNAQVSCAFFCEQGGLSVASMGPVTITDVSASSNSDYAAVGLFIDNCIATLGPCNGIGDVTIDTSDFNANGFAGILVDSGGSVSLTDVNANENGFAGAILGFSDPVVGSVTVTDSHFDQNSPCGCAGGLGIGALGAITLTNVSADSNGGDGALLISVDSVGITGGSFSNNSTDGIFMDGTVGAQINFNRIVGNGGYGVTNDNPGVTVDATNNWWGCNYGPGATGAGCSVVTNGVFGDVHADPWIILTMSPTTTEEIAANGGTLPLIAYLTTNSDGVDISGLGSIPDGTPATFATTLGAVGSPSITKTTTDGVAIATLTAGSTSGIADVTIQVDGQVLRFAVLIVPATESGVAAGSAQGGSDLIITITPLVGIPVTSLPFPSGNTFLAELNVAATLDGIPLSELPGDAVTEISFELPAGFTGTPVIWFQLPDGTWQAVRTFVVGNRAVAFVHMMGVYALGVQ